MAEKALENQVCPTCSADVRPDALFCYSCGGSLVQSSAVEIQQAKPDAMSNLWFQGNLTKDKKENHSIDSIGKIEKKIAEPVEVSPVPVIEKNPAVKNEKSNGQPQHPKLKTAAALRHKSRAAAEKKVEIVWEQRESAPNILFLIVALALALFAVGTLMAMLYLR